jgi:hypothetical protein
MRITMKRRFPRFSPISRPQSLLATLRMLRKLTREQTVDANDMRAVLAAGVSCEQIEDALAVCFSFNIIGRLADAFGFFMAAPEASRLERSTCSPAVINDPNMSAGVRRHVMAGSPEDGFCSCTQAP